MPIKFVHECKHCGQPVEQGADYFSPWFHSGRREGDDAMSCDPHDPLSKQAIPKIIVEKLKRKEEP